MQGLSVFQVLQPLLAQRNKFMVIGSLYSGVVPTGLAALVTGAAYLSIFAESQSLADKALKSLAKSSHGSNDAGSKIGGEWRDSSVLSAGLAAASASTAIACIELPIEMVRLRMQAGTAPGSFAAHIKGVWQDGMLGGWLTYLAPSLIKEVPQDATEFMTYGKLTRLWDSFMPRKADDTPAADWIIGAVAGRST